MLSVALTVCRSPCETRGLLKAAIVRCPNMAEPSPAECSSLQTSRGRASASCFDNRRYRLSAGEEHVKTFGNSDRDCHFWPSAAFYRDNLRGSARPPQQRWPDLCRRRGG